MKTRPHPDLLSGGALLLLAAGYGYVALRIPATEHEPGPRFFPVVLAIALGCIAAWIVASTMRAGRPIAATPPAEAGAAMAWARPMLAAAMTAGYAWALQPIGFPISTLAYVAGITAILSTSRTPLLVVPPLVTLALYLFFDVALGVRLP